MFQNSFRMEPWITISVSIYEKFPENVLFFGNGMGRTVS